MAVSLTTRVAPAAWAAACSSAAPSGAEGNHRQMFGGCVLFQSREHGTDVVPRGFQVGQHQQRLGLLGAFHQPARLRDRLDAVIQVLQPVDELAARQ